MRDHDVEVDGGVEAPSLRDTQDEALSGRDVGHGIEAGRPDALGPGGLLHLQRLAGNSSVSALVAQRSADHADHERDDERGDARSPVNDVVSSSGRPLEPGVRNKMESALGHDFGDVQVHSDGQAASSARSVQAQAYTVGNHVVFGEGRYQPETSEGQRTLAHELTHVVQQRQGPVDGTPAAGGVRVSDPSDRFEREAESVADRVMSPPSAEPAPVAGAPAVQRQEEPDANALPVQRQAAADEEEQEEAPPEAGAEAAPPSEAPAEGAAAEDAAPEQAGEVETSPEAVSQAGEEEQDEESVTEG
jgi:hypothetical protein